MSIRTLAMIGLGLSMVHCGGAQPAEASYPQPAPVSASAEPADAAPTPDATPPSEPASSTPPVAQTSCPSPDDAQEAKAHFEQAEKLLAESREGEHYLAVPFGKSMALFKSAAAKGHLEAQYKSRLEQF